MVVAKKSKDVGRDARETQEKSRDHNIMTGEVPSPINPPSGCVFHPRCSLAVESCKSDIPVLEDKRAGHFVGCTQV